VVGNLRPVYPPGLDGYVSFDPPSWKWEPLEFIADTQLRRLVGTEWNRMRLTIGNIGIITAYLTPDLNIPGPTRRFALIGSATLTIATVAEIFAYTLSGSTTLTVISEFLHA
jgi:hypothetical protein